MLVITGDLFLGNEVNITDRVIQKFNSSTYIVSNFENVLDFKGSEMREDKNAILTYASNNLTSYKSKLTSDHIFCLANNHIHDLGEDGISLTDADLQSQEIRSVGVGNQSDLVKPLLINGDRKIAMLCVSSSEPEVLSVLASDQTQGVLDWRNPRVIQTIKKVRDEVDYLIVMMHVGKEYMHLPSIQTRERAYSWIDHGADLIIGHHPHVVQGKEQYKGKWIYYSLGNYIFPEFYTKRDILKQWKKDNNHSVALRVSFTDEIEVEEIGLYFDTRTNTLDSNEESVNQLHFRSKGFQSNFKQYFGLWEKELFRVLKQTYSFKTFLSHKFPIHRKYGRFWFIFYRVKKKLKGA